MYLYLQLYFVFFFFNDTATTEIYTRKDTLSLHDALPILGDERDLGRLADPHPHDEERQHRQRRDRPQDLDDRLEQVPHQAEMSGRQPEAERQDRARREPDGHALERGGHVAPEQPVHRERRHLPQHAPRAREEDRIEEPEEHDEPGREAPQPEKREDGAEAQRERAPARERRPAEPPLHQVRHRAHPTTSSTA